MQAIPSTCKRWRFLGRAYSSTGEAQGRGKGRRNKRSADFGGVSGKVVDIAKRYSMTPLVGIQIASLKKAMQKKAMQINVQLLGEIPPFGYFGMKFAVIISWWVFRRRFLCHSFFPKIRDTVPVGMVYAVSKITVSRTFTAVGNQAFIRRQSSFHRPCHSAAEVWHYAAKKAF